MRLPGRPKIVTGRVRPGLFMLIALALLAVALLQQGLAQAAVPRSDGQTAGVPAPVETAPPTAGTPAATQVPTEWPTGVPTEIVTQVPTATSPPGPPTPLPTGFPTVVPCYVFSDVLPTDWFYQYVNWMACAHIVGGYGDGTFRPNNPTTRGQTAKIFIGAFTVPLHTEGGPHFADVATSSPFYPFIETAGFYGIVGGYPCGGAGEPCDEQNRPYFRPNALVTRSQITKIGVLTARQAFPDRWQLVSPLVATFADVPAGSPFYSYVETAVAHNILGGYLCGGPGEPCPGRYFRPGNDATRAQISKVTFLAVLFP